MSEFRRSLQSILSSKSSWTTTHRQRLIYGVNLNVLAERRDTKQTARRIRLVLKGWQFETIMCIPTDFCFLETDSEGDTTSKCNMRDDKCRVLETRATLDVGGPKWHAPPCSESAVHKKSFRPQWRGLKRSPQAIQKKSRPSPAIA